MCKLKSPQELDNLLEVAVYFSDEKVCLEYIEQWIWRGMPICPRCGNCEIYRYKNGKLLKCSRCKKQFNVLSGTIFEGTKIKLNKWFMVIYLLLNNKRGINACALGRQLKIRRATAWTMLHKLRAAMDTSDIKLEGHVASDEAFFGGKNKNRHYNKKMVYTPGRNWQDKIVAHGMIEKRQPGRAGNVKVIVIDSPSKKALRHNILTTVKPGSILVSDEYRSYRHVLNRYYDHYRVNHKKKQYQTKEGYTTNPIENFWTHCKNMVRGVYIKMTFKYLQGYLDEQCFRWNTMHLSEGERFAELFPKLAFRMTHKQLTGHG